MEAATTNSNRQNDSARGERQLAVVIQERCLSCGSCVATCEQGAIVVLANLKVQIDKTKCTGCGNCVDACTANAILIVKKPDLSFSKRVLKLALRTAITVLSKAEKTLLR